MSRISPRVREQVKLRAIDNRCEYCFSPESLSKYSFQVDHVIPSRHGGDDSLSNLAWACFNCNNSKGTDIATFEDGILTPLYNPRTQEWLAHFRVEQDGRMIGVTLEGSATIRLLQMNTLRIVQMRKILIDIKLW